MIEAANNTNVLEESDVSQIEIDEFLSSLDAEAPEEEVTDGGTDELNEEFADPVNHELVEPVKKEVLEEVQPIIPENSPTLLVEESTSRFSSAIWYEAVKKKTIVLAGVGGIGSYVAFLLSRMKPQSITLYDPDVVEEVNMSGQLYSKHDVGRSKVDAISAMMGSYSGYMSTMAVSRKFDSTTPPADIMICGFDNMQARATFFESWRKHVESLPEEDRKKCLFIDGRLAAEELQIFCITGDNPFLINKYSEEQLFSDYEADATVCSYKQTSHCANMIGSLMVNLFVNFVANECDPLIPRDLPYYTTYDAERMFFNTSMF